jgi:Homing endonuclease associated repeat
VERTPEQARPATKPCVICGQPTTSNRWGYVRLTCSEDCRWQAQRLSARDQAMDDGRTVWDREKIVRALQREAKRRGRPPKAKEWFKVGGRGRRPNIGDILRYFGSWNAALEAAGLLTRPHGGREPRWTPERIILALQKDAKRKGRPPRPREWRRPRKGRPVYVTVLRVFGDWAAALQAAGLPVPPWSGTPGRARKLTAEAVREIRLSAEPATVIAKRLGVHVATVRRVRRRVTYEDVD